MRPPGSSKLFPGIPRSDRRYATLWARRRRRELAFRVRESQATQRWIARHPERYHTLRTAWLAQNREELNRKRREYYDRFERPACHFCGKKAVGPRSHHRQEGQKVVTLRRIPRLVLEAGKWVERVVPVCRSCRGMKGAA
jgi:hypothetical protein